MITLRTQRKRRGVKRSRGQSMVEFALVLPVFLLVLTGLLDFGFRLYYRMTLIAGTREAARWAVVQPAANVSTIAADIASGSGHLATNLPGLDFSKISYVGTGSSPKSPTCITDAGVVDGCDFKPGGQPDPIKGAQIRLTTTYTYTNFFGSSVQISAQVQMTLEVPQS